MLGYVCAGIFIFDQVKPRAKDMRSIRHSQSKYAAGLDQSHALPIDFSILYSLGSLDPAFVIERLLYSIFF